MVLAVERDDPGKGEGVILMKERDRPSKGEGVVLANVKVWLWQRRGYGPGIGVGWV